VRALLCVLALLFASSMRGQSLAQETQKSAVPTSISTGSVAGVLKDPSGAVITGARVELNSAVAPVPLTAIEKLFWKLSFWLVGMEPGLVVVIWSE